MKKLKHKFITLFFALFTLTPFFLLFADDNSCDDVYKKNKYKTNETYINECSSCHFAYQAFLLPSNSWKKVILNLSSHFDVEVILDQETENIIREYLISNSAEHSSSKVAIKILKSLAGDSPLRITETPYFKEEHHEINSNVFNRSSIGSKSNCIACHTTAKQGNYDDDFINIQE
ncbi:MAG: diheme cytochrome c [Desulfomicrobium sp.]|nr:diheme cytochrome c [Desulfomicrobium sp.]MBV1719962.1 diheme cytochrome c [Desulfomicrobium sp.]MBV1746542.1 diheme cytochrome c [Desulfomicrobium sp.]